MVQQRTRSQIDEHWRTSGAAKQAVSSLIAAAQSDSKRRWEGAIQALGAIRDPSATKTLIALLPDMNAASALGEIGNPAAVAPLLRMLRTQSDSNEKGIAVQALARITDPEAVKALISALRDPNEWARQMAAKGLGKMGELARPAIPALNEALKDRSDRVREEATKALSLIQKQ